MSVASFLDYINHEKNYSSNTITAYRNDLESFQFFYKKRFNEVDLVDVQYSIVRSWIVELVDANISNRTINRKISSLKAYFNYLLKTKQITQNPLRKHRSLKVLKKLNVPFSENEINDAIRYFDSKTDFESVRNKLIIELLYSTGMRKAELIGIEESHLDLSQKMVKVLGKRNKERQIPLLKSVIKTIKNYQLLKKDVDTKVSNFFVTKKGEKLYPTLVYRIINVYFSKVSVKVKKSPHIIRHSFATHLLNEGADLNSVKELLGHSSLASTQVYTHNNLKELKKMYNNAHPKGNKNF